MQTVVRFLHMSQKPGTVRSTKAEIKEMLELRRQGLSFTVIGQMFGRDHTTVIFHCRRHNVVPEMKRQITKAERKIALEKFFNKEKVVLKDITVTLNPSTPPHQYQHIIDEKINPGKMTYKDYLKASGQKVYHAWKRQQKLDRI